MLRTQDVLADGIVITKQLLGRYLAGFDDTNRARQAPTLPNHVAWNLGHLALTMNRAAENLDGKPVPPEDLSPTPREGAFHTETIAFGSKPTDDPSHYPPMARCVAIFEKACDRMGAAVRAASDEQLTKTVKWGPGEIPLYMLAMRMIYHNGTHTGEIADLRRALGFKRVLG